MSKLYSYGAPPASSLFGTNSGECKSNDGGANPCLNYGCAHCKQQHVLKTFLSIFITTSAATETKKPPSEKTKEAKETKETKKTKETKEITETKETTENKSSVNI